MSEEMKLIKALCQALGFEVVVNLDYDEEKHSINSFHRLNPANYYGTHRRLKTKHDSQAYDMDTDGMYISRLINPITSYTVTKTAKEDI